MLLLWERLEWNLVKILVNNICIWIGQFKVDKKKHHIQNDREDV